jgi:hypothetical protein
MKDQIIHALRGLDPLNENHWTGQGLARVDVVAGMARLPDLTRKDIAEVAPGFNRDMANDFFDAEMVLRHIEKKVADGFDLSPTAPALLSELPAPTYFEPCDQCKADFQKCTGYGDCPCSCHAGVMPALTPLASLQAQLEDVQRQKFDLQAREADLLSRIDEINAGLAKTEPPPTLADNIQTYQQSQRDIRERQARQTQAMIDAGFVTAQKPLSPLDAALARGRKRGTNRPEYPKPQV